MLKIPGEIKLLVSPWKRTYLRNRKAKWQVSGSEYCDNVKKWNSSLLLDAIDVSIFDFLIQNGDRHHVSVFW